MKQSPEWYDSKKLKRIKYEYDESGWAIDMGDETYRLTNTPIRGMIGKSHPDVPQWGDLVKLAPNSGDNSLLEIIEKYEQPS